MSTAPADSEIIVGSFGLSESAAKRIEAMLENEPKGSFFRVAVNGGGCSGFQYEFSIDNSRQDEDRGFTSHGVEVVIDEMSLELVDSAVMLVIERLHLLLRLVRPSGLGGHAGRLRLERLLE